MGMLSSPHCGSPREIRKTGPSGTGSSAAAAGSGAQFQGDETFKRRSSGYVALPGLLAGFGTTTSLLPAH